MKKISIFLIVSAIFLSACTSNPPQNPYEPPNTKKTQNTLATQEIITNTITSELETDQSYKISALCTASPTTTDIGANVYPIDPKYGNLDYLGQFFTAYRCGPDRVKKIFGVEGDNYTLGSTILLKTNPSQPLIDTFKSIGFKCSENNADANCKKWELRDTVKVDDLIKLEPFHPNFQADDCINCG